MRVRYVRSIIAIAAIIAISKGSVGEIAFDDGTLCTVGVVEIPTPGATEEIESAVCLADGEVGEDFEGADKGADVVW